MEEKVLNAIGVLKIISWILIVYIYSILQLPKHGQPIMHQKLYMKLLQLNVQKTNE